MQPQEQFEAASPQTQDLNSCGTILKTHDGKIDSAQVTQATQGQISTDSAPIKYLSSNQTQEYFSVGTTQGFEIIMNDSSNTKLKKKI